MTGELTLRAALPEAGRLVAIVPPGFAAPADLAGRVPEWAQAEMVEAYLLDVAGVVEVAGRAGELASLPGGIQR